MPDHGQKRVVVIGGGFGGLRLVRALKRQPVQVVLIDKHNYHQFQPLLYQVATAGLEPDAVASPLRLVFNRYRNFHFRMAEVREIRTGQRMILTDIGEICYDYLVIAAGAKNNFHGMADLEARALSIKGLAGALEMRTIILQNFEKALLTQEAAELHSLMDYVIVGGGPTGVELAGALAELKKYILPRDYPELDLKEMEIYLVEGSGRLLAAMSERSSADALKALEAMGVKVLLGKRVKSYDGRTLTFADGDPIATRTVIWGAGVTPVVIPGLNPLAAAPGNHLRVDACNRVAGEENVFAIGDIAAMTSEQLPKGHPMLAPVAIQQGTHLGKNFRRLLRNEPLKPFTYWDKGTMATIGRRRAVADLPFVHFSGLTAWLSWMGVHLFYLIGFRNKLFVLADWTWNYFTYERRARLIIKPKPERVLSDQPAAVPPMHLPEPVRFQENLS